jgi:hypothetical protein
MSNGNPRPIDLTVYTDDPLFPYDPWLRGDLTLGLRLDAEARRLYGDDYAGDPYEYGSSPDFDRDEVAENVFAALTVDERAALARRCVFQEADKMVLY